MEYAHWWEAHQHWLWITPFVVMILMFAFAAFMIRRAGGCRWGAGNRRVWAPFGCCGPRQDPGPHSRAESPRQILDRRYACGEITCEQYEQIKCDIESSSYESEPSQ